ncbi:MAG: hypothetical protein U0269_28500 [Polyangiales bacterium]
MRSNLPAIEALSQLATRGASGEFICRTAARETHVFLLKGRVAWAFDNHARSVFWKSLSASASVDQATQRAVIEECRRTGRSVADTIVEWGVATREQVFDALDEQVRASLEPMRAEPSAQHIFLERRQFAEREAPWTLDLLSFGLGQSSRSGRWALRSSVPPPRSEANEASEASETNAASAVRWDIPGVERVVESDGVRSSSARIAGLARVAPLLDSSTDLVVAKTSERWIIGADNGGTRRWFAVAPAANLGAVFASLVQRGLVERTRAAPPTDTRATSSALAPRAAQRYASQLGVVARYAEVRAAFVLAQDGALLDVLDRSSTNHSESVARAARVCTLLDDAAQPQDAAVILSAIAIRSDVLLLGARVGAESAWIVVGPDATLGVAWTMLGSLLRKMRE